MTIDFRAYPVLYVDDERENLLTFDYALSERFAVLTAGSGEEALELLKQHDVAVLLCDQRMPGMTGVALCERAEVLRPETVRMLITAYADIEAAIGAINQGRVSRYLLKPWRPDEIEQVLAAAIEVVHLNAEVRRLRSQLTTASPRHGSMMATAELLHEIANPLSAVTMTLAEATDHALRIGNAPNLPPALRGECEELASLHDEMNAGVTQLNALLQRMRRDASLGPQPGHCDLKLVVESSARIVRSMVAPHARLDVHAPSRLWVAVDASVAAEIAINLMLNASQAIEHSGLTNRKVEIGFYTEVPYAVLRVGDEGPGIPAENLERVFESSFSTRGEGRGLGLRIVRDLVERAGGKVRVESEPGQGTVFEVRLPLLKNKS